jgi:hypothetical protein
MSHSQSLVRDSQVTVLMAAQVYPSGVASVVVRVYRTAV